jgi:trimethylamine--corrinoid protein Co-methyltransferase
MAHYFDLPVFSTAGCTDAVSFDEQAAAESAISCLMAALSGASLVHDVGFTEAANSASLELIAATNEFIDMAEAIVSGIAIGPETLALDVVDQVGPGGSYLAEDHTLERFREGWFPDLMNRSNYEDWAAAGAHSLGDKANAKVCRILREHEPTPLPPAVVSELDVLETNWWKEVEQRP